MHSILWASILASAGVAVITTLLVEYLAKPRLEARKERILDKGRQHTIALNGLRRSTLQLYRLLQFRQDPEIISMTSERIARITAELEENMLTAFGFMEIPEAVGKQWEDTTSAINAYALIFPAVIKVPPGEYWNDFSAAFYQLRNFEVLLTTSRRHVWRRRNLIKKIRSFDLPNAWAEKRIDKDSSLSSGHQEGKAELWQ